MGNSDQAVSYFNEAIKIKPDFHKAWFTLGTSYEADNNFEKGKIKCDLTKGGYSSSLASDKESSK